MRTAAAAVILLATAPAVAAELPLPDSARLTAEVAEPLGSFDLPVGPVRQGKAALLPVEGQVSHQAFRIEGSRTTLELLAPLRTTLQAEGFSILYECEARACGGFDFRYEADFLPEPDMHVDLADFRYLAAVRDAPGGPEHAMILASRSSEAGFVQLSRIAPPGAAPLSFTVSTKSSDPETDAMAETVARAVAATPRLSPDLLSALTQTGAVALDDLAFASGSAELGAGPFASLAELADWLRADPSRAITLVGHTDAEGTLEANIRLSKARAEAVRARLVSDFGVGADQVAAEGVGFLAPRAANADPAGRMLNRRVEAVLR